jgi:hypothetical protein
MPRVSSFPVQLPRCTDWIIRAVPYCTVPPNTKRIEDGTMELRNRRRRPWVQKVRPDWMRQFDWQGKQAAPILGKHPTQGGRQLALIGGGGPGARSQRWAGRGVSSQEDMTTKCTQEAAR